MARQPFLTRRSIPASRLKPPLLPRAFVSRPSLLDRAAQAQYVAVIAPGGYGKTCFLAELAGQAKKSVWYTVRAEDSDPSLFAFGLATAIGAAQTSEQHTQILDALSTQSGFSAESSADMLVQLASSVQGEWLLALDDCQLIEPGSGTIALLDRFLADAPSEMRFAYDGRAPLPLSAISRGQAAGLLAEIGPNELRFDTALAVQALRDEGLTDPQVEEVTRLCEGWPVLIRLAASLLARSGESLVALSGNRETVYQYIATELFGTLTGPVQNLLLKTSGCDSFTVALADHMIGASSASLIKKAENAGWLERTQTEEGVSYSYHPLLGDFLWSRFSLESPGSEVKGSLIRAGEWMATQERWDEAFEFWKKAGANEKIVEQLYVWEQEYVEYWPVHGRWLNTLSVEELTSRPRLILRKALGYQLSLNTNEAFRWQGIAEEIIAKSGDKVAEVDARAIRAQINFFALNVDEAERMYLDLEKQTDSLLDRQRLSTYAGLALVEMHKCDNLDRAFHYLEEVRKLATATRNWRALCLAIGNLMTTYRIVGRFAEVSTLLSEYSSDDPNASMLPRIYRLMGLSASAGDLAREGFEDYIAECIQHCEISNFNWLTSSMRGAQALFLAERGRTDEAERSVQAWTRTPSTHQGVATSVEIARALIACHNGDREEALRRLSLATPTYSSMGTFEPSAALAFILLGDLNEARSRAAAAAEEGRRRGMNFVEASALFMLAAADGATAKDLQRLVHLSKELGYESMFLRRWPNLAPKVLIHALARNVDPEYVIKLLRQTGVHTLRVQTFGGLRVWLNDVELDDQAWERPKSKALFAYLLIRDGKPAHSEEIAELFWPDQDVAAAKNSLRVAATRIRKAIEREERHLVFEADHYKLDLGSAGWQDRKAFELLTEAGLNAEDPGQATEFLKQALETFSDDFLPEYRFEEWAEAERERLETIRRKARLRLCKHLISLNEGEAAIVLCEAAVAQDPFDETAVRLHMRALAKLQRQDEARRIFLKLEKALSEQLRSKPTDATMRLVQELAIL